MKAALLGAFCVAPAMSLMPVAQAAPITVKTHSRALFSFTGFVTDVKSSQKFEVRTGGKIYNVVTTHPIPRNLHKGSMVRVSGERAGSNGVRNAAAIVLNNHNPHH